jgi:hypothetical protein
MAFTIVVAEGASVILAAAGVVAEDVCGRALIFATTISAAAFAILWPSSS